MQTLEVNGKKITFRLRTVGNNLFLEATHINGEEAVAGNLLVIDKEGRYGRCTHVNDEFGFKLNADRQIKKTKEGF